VDIAQGISLSQGVSHNSMVVEMDKYLIVFDAPIGEQFSEWFIDAAKKRYPGKPIRYRCSRIITGTTRAAHGRTAQRVPRSSWAKA
jgi:hypothetical protein